MDTLKDDAADNEPEPWKGPCRDLKHFSQDIEKLAAKVMAFLNGDVPNKVALLERDCQGYLTVTHRRQGAMHRAIDAHRISAYYSLKRMIDEKRAVEIIADGYKARTIAWLPAIPPTRL